MPKKTTPPTNEYWQALVRDLGTSAKQVRDTTINAVKEQRAKSVNKFHAERDATIANMNQINFDNEYSYLISFIENVFVGKPALGLEISQTTNLKRKDKYINGLFKVQVHKLSGRNVTKTELWQNIQEAFNDYIYFYGYALSVQIVGMSNPIDNRFDLGIRMWNQNGF